MNKKDNGVIIESKNSTIYVKLLKLLLVCKHTVRYRGYPNNI